MRFIHKDKALKTVLIYAVFGGLWILFSDKALEAFVPSATLLSALQTVKGWLFILCTSLLLYPLIRRHLDVLRAKERQILRTTTYLDSIINSMPSVIIGVDAETRIVKWNKTAEELTGFSQTAAVGHPINTIYKHPALEKQTILEVLGSGKPMVKDKVPRTQGDRMVYETITIYPTSANNIDGAVIRIDDDTENVRMEEVLVQSEKMLSVGGLAAGMAHEINNPLGGISQSAQNIERRLMQDITPNQEAADKAGTELSVIQEYMRLRKIPHLLTGIRDSVERAGHIVSNMLNFSRTTTKDELHDINTMVAETLSLAAKDYSLKKKYDFKSIKISTEFGEGLPPVLCSANEIEQVLLNLMLNAAQAMAKSGMGRPPELRLRTYQKSNSAYIEVEDNGPGMDDNTRKRIFEPFFTTKPPGEGTGLGLSVSYFIITRNHGGELSVESTPGHGTKFIVRLPLRKDTPSRT